MSRYDMQAEPGGALTPLGMAKVPTLKERLAQSVEQARERLAVTEEAKALLDKNPDLERLLDLMQKGLF